MYNIWQEAGIPGGLSMSYYTVHTSLILVCFWSAPAPAARVWVALEYLFYLIKISKQVPNTSTGTFIHPKLKFQIFYFRVYNILHTPLLFQLEREDKWFCGRMNTFKYKIWIRNSNTVQCIYRYRTNFLTFHDSGRVGHLFFSKERSDLCVLFCSL